MNLKQKILAVLIISSNMYYCASDKDNPENSITNIELLSLPIEVSSNMTQGRGESPEVSPIMAPDTASELLVEQLPLPPSALSSEEEPTSSTPGQFILPTSQQQSHIHISYNPDDTYVYTVSFLGETFNEKLHYHDSCYWQNKLDKLQEMIGDISSNEDDILMLLQEIISHAPEKYRYEAYNSFQSYNPRKKSLLDDELSLVYIPECLMYGSKTEEKKEEVVIHLTSDPKLFDKVFKVVPIRERPKVSEASRIRREKQEAEYREQQRIHAEQYKAKERALKRANGEDMIFDPRVGKRVHFEDYLRSLFLSANPA